MPVRRATCVPILLVLLLAILPVPPRMRGRDTVQGLPGTAQQTGQLLLRPASSWLSGARGRGWPTRMIVMGVP